MRGQDWNIGIFFCLDFLHSEKLREQGKKKE